MPYKNHFLAKIHIYLIWYTTSDLLGFAAPISSVVHDTNKS
jgi:hypothetical protein